MSVIGSLLSLVLLLFLIALVVRAVLDWTSMLASGGSHPSPAARDQGGSRCANETGRFR